MKEWPISVRFRLEHSRNPRRQCRVARCKNPIDVAILVQDNPPGQLFMLDAAHAFKHMTERPMPQIVKQRSGEAGQFLVVVDRGRQTKLREHAAGGLHHAEAVAIAGMLGVMQTCLLYTSPSPRDR